MGKNYVYLPWFWYACLLFPLAAASMFGRKQIA